MSFSKYVVPRLDLQLLIVIARLFALRSQVLSHPQLLAFQSPSGPPYFSAICCRKTLHDSRRRSLSLHGPQFVLKIPRLSCSPDSPKGSAQKNWSLPLADSLVRIPSWGVSEVFLRDLVFTD
jgi:hypothetical protein